MNNCEIQTLQMRRFESDDWRPVFATNAPISLEYAMRYMDLNAELGWSRYRIVFTDGSVL